MRNFPECAGAGFEPRNFLAASNARVVPALLCCLSLGAGSTKNGICAPSTMTVMLAASSGLAEE